MRLLSPWLLILFLCGTRPLAPADYWIVDGHYHLLVGEHLFISSLSLCANKNASIPKLINTRDTFTCVLAHPHRLRKRASSRRRRPI